MQFETKIDSSCPKTQNHDSDQPDDLGSKANCHKALPLPTPPGESFRFMGNDALEHPAVISISSSASILSSGHGNTPSSKSGRASGVILK